MIDRQLGWVVGGSLLMLASEFPAPCFDAILKAVAVEKEPE